MVVLSSMLVKVYLMKTNFPQSKELQLAQKHIHDLAEAYGATVILHTDHCDEKIIALD